MDNTLQREGRESKLKQFANSMANRAKEKAKQAAKGIMKKIGKFLWKLLISHPVIFFIVIGLLILTIVIAVVISSISLSTYTQDYGAYATHVEQEKDLTEKGMSEEEINAETQKLNEAQGELGFPDYSIETDNAAQDSPDDTKKPVKDFDKREVPYTGDYVAVEEVKIVDDLNSNGESNGGLWNSILSFFGAQKPNTDIEVKSKNLVRIKKSDKPGDKNKETIVQTDEQLDKQDHLGNEKKVDYKISSLMIDRTDDSYMRRVQEDAFVLSEIQPLGNSIDRSIILTDVPGGTPESGFYLVKDDLEERAIPDEWGKPSESVEIPLALNAMINSFMLKSTVPYTLHTSAISGNTVAKDLGLAFATIDEFNSKIEMQKTYINILGYSTKTRWEERERTGVFNGAIEEGELSEILVELRKTSSSRYRINTGNRTIEKSRSEEKYVSYDGKTTYDDRSSAAETYVYESSTEPGKWRVRGNANTYDSKTKAKNAASVGTTSVIVWEERLKINVSIPNFEAYLKTGIPTAEDFDGESYGGYACNFTTSGSVFEPVKCTYQLATEIEMPIFLIEDAKTWVGEFLLHNEVVNMKKEQIEITDEDEKIVFPEINIEHDEKEDYKINEEAKAKLSEITDEEARYADLQTLSKKLKEEGSENSILTVKYLDRTYTSNTDSIIIEIDDEIENTKLEYVLSSTWLMILQEATEDVWKLLKYDSKTAATALDGFSDFELPSGDIEGLSNIFAWPVQDEFNKITSWFGIRKRVNGAGTETHTGIDIGGSNIDGKPVRAAGEGIVEYVGYQANGYGNYVIVKHTEFTINGRVPYTLYAHGSVVIAKKGDVVNPETVIMNVGSTGRSSGPHLHFEIRLGSMNGTKICPYGKVIGSRDDTFYDLVIPPGSGSTQGDNLVDDDTQSGLYSDD